MAERTEPANTAEGVDEPEVEAWERRMDWPLTGLAAVFLRTAA